MPQLRIILMKAEMPGISDVCLKNATCSSCLIKILAKASVNAAVPEKFPVIVREGVNEEGEKLRFYLNYSWEEQRVEVADDF